MGRRNEHRWLVCVAVVIAILAGLPVARAQRGSGDPELEAYIRSHYAKFESRCGKSVSRKQHAPTSIERSN